MLDVAETLNDLLNQQQERISNLLDDDEEDYDDATTLQIVFFDGEEAFRDWTDTDSCYGSRHVFALRCIVNLDFYAFCFTRHLAEKWESEYLSSHTKTRRKLTLSQTKLSTIEHLVLLDLLGSKKPRISSYYLTTGWLFDNLVSVEERLHASGAFSSQSDGEELDSFFAKRVGNQINIGGIGDDHMPFLKRGVSVLHVITSPFPFVWHKLSVRGIFLLLKV